MQRDLRPGLLAAALALSLLAAHPAVASEGDIVLWPDWTSYLPVMILLFVALLAPVNALLFRPLLRAIDLRADRIAGTRERAEKLAASADEVLARYEQAVREVRVEAEQTRRDELASAREESSRQMAGARTGAEQEIERARREVAAGLGDARTRLRADAQTLAREAASRVLGRVVS